MLFKMFVVIISVLIISPVSFPTTTLQWWQFWTDSDIKPIIREIVQDFEKANPEIKIDITDLTWANGHEKIVIAFTSGTGPDIVELGSDWMAQFADNGHLAEISDYIVADSSKYEGWRMAEYKGAILGKPWILGTRILYGNKDLLQQAGYHEDFVPLKWEELKTATKSINKLGPKIYGWGSNISEKHRLYKKFLPFFWSNGASFFSENGKYCLVSSLKAIEALKFYKELHDSTGFVANQRGIEDAFLEGKVGFIISGDWLLKRIKKENRKINFMTGLIPGPQFPGKSFLGGQLLAVNSASNKKEAAMKFINFITSPENQVKFCKASHAANPSSLMAQEDEYFKNDIHIQTFIKQIKSSVHPPVDPDWVNIENIMEEAIEDALFGSNLVAEPLRQAKHKILKIKNR